MLNWDGLICLNDASVLSNLLNADAPGHAKAIHDFSEVVRQNE